MKKVIKILEERERQLLVVAGEHARRAQARATEAQEESTRALVSYMALIEVATGDPDPVTISLEPDTGELWREEEAPKPRKGRGSGKPRGKP